MNFMVYMRGNRRDYDNWATNEGLDGWSYEEVLPWFRLSEDNRDFPASEYHGVGGPLTVSRAPFRSPLQSAYLMARPNLINNLFTSMFIIRKPLFRMEIRQ